MWRVEIEYTDGTTKTLEASDKFTAKAYYNSFALRTDVSDVSVYDDDGEYVDECEL